MKKQRIIMLDILKALAIIMVVITHVADIPRGVKQMLLWPYIILPAVPIFLILSIYAYSKSVEKTGGTNVLLSWFEKKPFLKRVNRFLVPYSISIAILCLGLILNGAKGISIMSIIKMFLQGGRGPGGYYIIITFQLLVLYPFMKNSFDKRPMVTVLFLVIFNIFYEVFVEYSGMSDETYRLLIFRFFTHFALGFILYRYEIMLNRTILPMIAIIVGGIYLLEIYYLGYSQILVRNSATQSPIAALYAFGIVCYALRLESFAQKIATILAPLCYIGKASFHILLTQMIYYYFARIIEFENNFESIFIRILVDLFITVGVGCFFYYLENSFRNKLCIIKFSH